MEGEGAVDGVPARSEVVRQRQAGFFALPCTVPLADITTAGLRLLADLVDEEGADREEIAQKAARVWCEAVLRARERRQQVRKREHHVYIRHRQQKLLLRLQHMIVSHHGEYAFGSPKLPMTMEAMALHYLDNLDAKMHNVKQLLQEDTGGDSRWTSYNAPLGRKFFKGSK